MANMASQPPCAPSVQFLGVKDPLKVVMAAHYSIVAWRIPRTEEPTVHTAAKSQTQLKRLSTQAQDLCPIIKSQGTA